MAFPQHQTQTRRPCHFKGLTKKAFTLSEILICSSEFTSWVTFTIFTSCVSFASLTIWSFTSLTRWTFTIFTSRVSFTSFTSWVRFLVLWPSCFWRFALWFTIILAVFRKFLAFFKLCAVSKCLGFAVFLAGFTGGTCKNKQYKYNFRENFRTISETISETISRTISGTISGQFQGQF